MRARKEATFGHDRHVQLRTMILSSRGNSDQKHQFWEIHWVTWVLSEVMIHRQSSNIDRIQETVSKVFVCG